MENKYYTPSIEEFHVGFEYEWECDGTQTDWTKSVCNTSMNPLDIDCIRVNNYRVKYLDKEDIESLGFKEDQEYQSTVDESNYDWHFDYGMESNNKELKLIYTNWRTYGASEMEEIDYSKHNEYSVVKIVKRVIPGEEFTAFVGVIKNK